MGLLGLLRRKPHERTGFELYGAAVAAARHPWFYGETGVPDTLDGRFDLVALHVALLIRRLRRDTDPRGPEVAQAVFDAMFADMDLNLREMGVGDLSVGKRVKRMWEAFHGRALAYEAALDGQGELEAALARNVWRDSAPPGGAAALSAQARRIADALEGQGFAELVRGRVTFPAPAVVAGRT